MDYSHLPYRQGVQVYVIKDEHLLLVTNADDETFFKPPSGGKDPGESAEQTCLREMQEELGVEVQILKHCSFTNTFLWPERVILIFDKQFKGQHQEVFIVTIEDKNALVFEEDEIGLHRWIPLDKVASFLPLDNQKETWKKVYAEYLKLNQTF